MADPIKTVLWHPPELGLLKLKVDVAVDWNIEYVGVGVVIRDASGNVASALTSKLK
ncbi:hypothetical protein TorRG33x02_144140, partial [Trema orientale]